MNGKIDFIRIVSRNYEEFYEPICEISLRIFFENFVLVFRKNASKNHAAKI
jgi:hypothetical protein